jgi:hypothetical protein
MLGLELDYWLGQLGACSYGEDGRRLSQEKNKNQQNGRTRQQKKPISSSPIPGSGYSFHQLISSHKNQLSKLPQTNTLYVELSGIIS